MVILSDTRDLLDAAITDALIKVILRMEAHKLGLHTIGVQDNDGDMNPSILLLSKRRNLSTLSFLGTCLSHGTKFVSFYTG